MPYKKSNADPPMTILLRGRFRDGSGLARILGVSVPTGIKKLKQPELLTLGDLDKINRFGHIPIEEIRAAIGSRAK